MPKSLVIIQKKKRGIRSWYMIGKSGKKLGKKAAYREMTVSLYLVKNCLTQQLCNVSALLICLLKYFSSAFKEV